MMIMCIIITHVGGEIIILIILIDLVILVAVALVTCDEVTYRCYRWDHCQLQTAQTLSITTTVTHATITIPRPANH